MKSDPSQISEGVDPSRLQPKPRPGGRLAVDVGSLLLLAGLGWVLSRLAYQTTGGGMDTLFLVVQWIAFLPALLLLALGKRGAAPMLVLTVTLLLGVLPVRYSIRLFQLQNEARGISTFAVEKWRKTRRFPEDLRDYTFREPALREYLHYRSTDTRFGFHLAPSGNFNIGYYCGVDADPPLRCIDGELTRHIPDLENGPIPCSRRRDWFFSND